MAGEITKLSTDVQIMERETLLILDNLREKFIEKHGDTKLEDLIDMKCPYMHLPVHERMLRTVRRRTVNVLRRSGINTIRDYMNAEQTWRIPGFGNRARHDVDKALNFLAGLNESSFKIT